MAKRAQRKAPPAAPFDIFGDERLGAAMTAATADVIKGEGLPVGQAEAVEVVEDVAEVDVVEHEVAQAEAPEQPAEPAPRLRLEENVPLKFQVPRSMRSEFQAFKAEIGAALGGVVLDDSNLGRALLDRLLGAEREHVLAAARARVGELRRPKNGDPQAMAAFDEAIRALLMSD